MLKTNSSAFQFHFPLPPLPPTAATSWILLEFANIFGWYNFYLGGREEQTVCSYYFTVLKPNRNETNQNISSCKYFKVLSLAIFTYTSGGSCHPLATVAMKERFFCFLDNPKCSSRDAKMHTMLAEMAENRTCAKKQRQERMAAEYTPFSVAASIRVVVAVSRTRKISKTITLQTCQNYL